MHWLLDYAISENRKGVESHGLPKRGSAMPVTDKRERPTPQNFPIGETTALGGKRAMHQKSISLWIRYIEPNPKGRGYVSVRLVLGY